MDVATKKKKKKKGNLKRETESFLMAAQNNDMRIDNANAKIGKRQQNSTCMLCSDRDQTINPIISECSKPAQKEYKTRHDLIGRLGIVQEIKI